jgi:SAM-dependent methyltransferase
MAEGSNPRYIDRELEMKYAEDKNGNPRTRGMLVRRFTGDSTPYSFPVTPIRLVKEWPDEPPFKPEDFFRADEIDDGSFYAVPRLVYHIDEPAVASLTQYYRNNIPAGSNILDICSSWISHYPLEFPDTMKRISATGMNKLELMYNDQLTDYQAKNLNVDPTLPYDDNTFNVVTCVVSIDYLVSPIQVLKEVNRVLKPGGKVIISQSNRCFPSKAIAMWLQMNDRQHLELINGYLKYAGGFKDVEAFDITATDPGNKYNDPMFIVQAEKA